MIVEPPNLLDGLPWWFNHPFEAPPSGVLEQNTGVTLERPKDLTLATGGSPPILDRNI
jgi:hypothetical protein